MKSGAESGWDYSSRYFQRFPKKIEDFISRWFVGNESLDGEEELLKVKLPIINRKSLQSLNLANIEQPSPDWCQQQKNRWGPPTLSRSTWTASYARTPRSSQTSLPGFRCSHFFFAIFIFFLVNRMENQAKSAEYERKYESLRDSIHAVLYSDNLWHDFNIVTRYFKLENAYKQHMSEKKYNQAAHRGILSQQPCSSLLWLHPSLPRPCDGGRRNRKT